MLPGCATGSQCLRFAHWDAPLRNRMSRCVTGVQLRNRVGWLSVRNIFTGRVDEKVSNQRVPPTTNNLIAAIIALSVNWRVIQQTVYFLDFSPFTLSSTSAQIITMHGTKTDICLVPGPRPAVFCTGKRRKAERGLGTIFEHTHLITITRRMQGIVGQA